MLLSKQLQEEVMNLPELIWLGSLPKQQCFYEAMKAWNWKNIG